MGRSAQIPRLAGQLDGDDTHSRILHVDMDAFFASVEILARPELAGLPVVVGGRERGVVAAASYAAREYGVRSAMSMASALRLCPHAVVLPPNRAAYTAASAAVMATLREVTELVEPLSLDEAFLDVAGAVRRMGRPADIARWIRAKVEADLGLTCSVGVAPTKFVAKVASARSKPDGLLVVPADGVLEFLHPLPVTALWGVGDRTAESLHRLGVRTVGDLAGLPDETLRRAVGQAGAAHLAALAVGDDPRPVTPDVGEKSVSSDRTLAEDLLDEPAVAEQLLRLSGDVGRRLRAKGVVGRTVGIKIRFADFRTITRARTLPAPTDSDDAIYAAALALYRALDLDRPRIRLVGVKAEGLREPVEVAEQLSFDDLGPAEPAAASAPRPRPVPARDVLDAVRDAARERFGDAAVRPGTLVRPGGTRREG